MDTNRILLLLAVVLPLLAAPVIALAGRSLGRRVGWFAFAFPVISVAALLLLAARMGLPGSLVIEWPWIPSLGINFSFLLDGLSLFFALIVSGVGVLIFFYANFYLDDHYEHHGRFYCYLALFMAAMLGTVLANNLMLLFVFWELTGLASFLLIGFLHHEEKSRVGARQALLLTGFTGLLLLAGVIMVWQVTGTYDLATLLGSGLPLADHKDWLTVAMLLMLLGAFGKSAQFPLHFWLPNAMAAPTPVSAYLHSATVVKLGVFLCARIFPLFVENELWAPVLALVAFTTMLFGAVMALLSHDLKAILAYSTVSQLGYLIGYYGLGPAHGVEYDFLHILNHVFYKGCLFMVAGIVIHATGVQDIRQLGGLRRQMPWLAGICLVAAATMAGFPGTTGFLSKETMLKEIFEAMNGHGALGAYATVCVVLTSLVKVAFSFRFFANIFLGDETETVKAHFHAPPFAVQLPPLVLAGAALLLGVWPGLLTAPFHWLTVEGLHQPTPHLSLWHGVTRELLVSMAVVLLGFGLFYVGQRTAWRWAAIPRALRFDDFFERGIESFSKFTKWLTRFLRADKPVDYLPVIIAFMLCVVGGFMVFALRPVLGELATRWEWEMLALHPLRSFVAALIALAVIGVLLLRRWTTQLILLSVAGFLTTFYYVLYRAPDLALTQILIEVVTLFLILILLGRFPRSAELGEIVHRPSRLRKQLNVVLSLGVGVLMTTFILWFNAAPHENRLGRFFAENTVELAQGSNTVNTILVDFRGFDTLGEITVLLIAMLGGIGLLMRYKRTAAEYREGPLGQPGMGIQHSEEQLKVKCPSPPSTPLTRRAKVRGGAWRGERGIL